MPDDLAARVATLEVLVTTQANVLLDVLKAHDRTRMALVELREHYATESALIQCALESQAASLQALRTLVAAWRPGD
jgi:hypothetical protein